LKELQKYVDEGHYSWKAFGLIAGVLLVMNGFLSFAYEIMALSPLMAILNVYLIIFGVILIVLEYKEKTFTKRFCDIIRKEALFLSRPYGRGAFYTFCGTLLVCKGGLFSFSFIIGLFISGLGICIFVVSRRATLALEAHRADMTDEEAVRAKFYEFDKDKSGALDSPELAKLCQSLGSPLTYNQLESALLLLDKDGDGAVEFGEFFDWWRGRDE